MEEMQKTLHSADEEEEDAWSSRDAEELEDAKEEEEGDGLANTEQQQEQPEPITSEAASSPVDIPSGLRYRGNRDDKTSETDMLVKGAMRLIDDEDELETEEDEDTANDQTAGTPNTPTFMPSNLEELMSVRSRALDKAEEFVGELMAVPSKTYHKAEELAEGLKSVPGNAYHKAEELAEGLMSVPGKAYDKAEELAEGLRNVPSKAYDKAEEIAENLRQVPSKAYDQAAKAYDKAEELAEGLMAVPSKALNKAEEIAHRVWTVVHHHHLPSWLRDNDFLVKGHRPPLNSFGACFKSIFRIHTETGNIWTHLLGFVAFIVVSCYFLMKPSVEMEWKQKAVYSAFFFGAICCLGFSWTFHTLHCHSEKVGRIFSKLDYCGIALLEMGSFVPWMYYSFYCRQVPQIVYTVIMFVLGIASIVVSMWDRFADPVFRPVRAGTFIGLGMSGGIPALHYVITDGFWEAINFAALGWLILMGGLYIAGALIYAWRIPERIWPGKFDIWFQSHQIFHVFVVAAAFIHLHAISGIATHRLSSLGDCTDCHSSQEERVETLAS